MNDIDKMPSKCRDCAYWELAREPYVCTDCESRMERLSDLSKPMPNDDYIKRSDCIDSIKKAEKWWWNADDLREYREIFESIPAADVEPVVHGRWIPGKAVYSEYNEGRLVARYYDQWVCSVCNYVINDQHYSRISYKRCPECGAHMDAEPPKEDA